MADIADLSDWGIGVAINGGGSQGVELPLGGSIDARGFPHHVVSVAGHFAAFFGFASDITSDALNFNGNDEVELYCQGVVKRCMRRWKWHLVGVHRRLELPC